MDKYLMFNHRLMTASELNFREILIYTHHLTTEKRIIIFKEYIELIDDRLKLKEDIKWLLDHFDLRYHGDETIANYNNLKKRYI